MTWSLQLQGGDISPTGAHGYAVVSGSQKLMQDVRSWMLEPRGSDPMHPEGGSTLDGGTLPDGSVVPTSLGTAGDAERLAEIDSEIRRVLFAYQRVQVARAEREALSLGGLSTFSPGELLWDVADVQLRQYQDVVLAGVALVSSNGTSIPLVQPVG